MNYKFLSALACLSLICGVCRAEDVAQRQDVKGEACDDRRSDDDAQTAENRAIDKAGLAAVKTSGIIQKYNNSLSSSALDVISYQIIDNYMHDVKHEVTLDEAKRICVKLEAYVAVTDDEMNAMIEEFKTLDTPHFEEVDDVVQIAQQVKDTTTFKPQSPDEKKLVYIKKMHFWNDVLTDHYTDFIKQFLTNSDYLLITEDESLADFVFTPSLIKSEVTDIDNSNNKMQMQLVLQVSCEKNADFNTLSEQQNHFILFDADKDEQEVADSLIKKLLERAVKNVNKKLENYIGQKLEDKAVRGKE